MINIFIQGLTLFSALLVNFLIPLAFGLTKFGDFVKVNAIVFTVAKIMDAFNEPFLALLKKEEVLSASLLINFCVFVALCILSQWWEIGSLSLLLSMLLTASVLISLFANDLRKLVAIFLIIYLTVFVILSSLVKLKIVSLEIVSILTIINFTSVTFGMVALFVRTKIAKINYKNFILIFASVPSLLSAGLVINFWSNLSPLIFGQFISLRDVGILRISVSIVQSSSSIFPIPTRAILLRMKIGYAEAMKCCDEMINSSLVYFSSFSLMVLSVALLHAPIRNFVHILLIIPFFYWCIIYERYLWSVQKFKTVSILNLILFILLVFISFYIKNLEGVFRLYIFSYLIYLIFLRYFIVASNRVWELVFLASLVVLSSFVWNYEIYYLWMIAFVMWLYSIIRHRDYLLKLSLGVSKFLKDKHLW